MEDKLTILKEISNFLEPISKFILFIFTSKIGISILILFFLFYFFIVLINRIKERKLLLKTFKNNEKLPFKDFIFIFIEEISKFFGKIISNISSVFTVVLVLLAVVGLSATFSTFNTFFENQQKIKELKQVVKNLNQRYAVLKVEVLDYNQFTDSTKLKIGFYDYIENYSVPESQIVTLPGSNIYFQSLVMNFDYSLIEAGEAKNIAIPYLIFSEKLSQSNGIPLNVYDKNGVPFIFHRSQDDLYGISEENYYNRLNELIDLMNNPEKAKTQGVRSYYSSAPHFVKALQKGQTFIVWVEQTGGLTIKKEEEW